MLSILQSSAPLFNSGDTNVRAQPQGVHRVDGRARRAMLYEPVAWARDRRYTASTARGRAVQAASRDTRAYTLLGPQA